MNVYEKLANLVRTFDSVDFLASEIESLVDHTEKVETLDELKKSYRCSKFNCKYN